MIYQVSMSLAVLLFFSIASVKRDDYILPALPGIAILCASVFTLAARGWAAKLRDALVVLLLGMQSDSYRVPAILPARKSAIERRSLLRGFPNSRANLFTYYSSHGWLTTVAAIYALVRHREIVIGAAFGLLALIGSLLWTIWLRPGLADARSINSFVPIIAAHVKPDQLCIPNGINYELSYYYGAAVPDLTNPKCAYLLATPRELDAITPEYRARLKPLAKSNLIGGGGPPALFEISPEAAK